MAGGRGEMLWGRNCVMERRTDSWPLVAAQNRPGEAPSGPQGRSPWLPRGRSHLGSVPLGGAATPCVPAEDGGQTSACLGRLFITNRRGFPNSTSKALGRNQNEHRLRAGMEPGCQADSGPCRAFQSGFKNKLSEALFSDQPSEIRNYSLRCRKEST